MSIHRVRAAILLGGLMSALSACGPSAPPTPPAATGGVGASPAASPAPARIQIDKIDAGDRWDTQAGTACEDGRFPEFLEAFVRSRSVARRYSARQVSVVRAASRTGVAGAAYVGAPITLVDHRWVTAVSAARGAPFDRVEMQINQSSDNRVLVEWRPVEYGPPGPEEEEGRILRQTGPAGALLFAPTDHCWALVEDRIGSGAP